MKLPDRPKARDDLIFRQVEDDFVVYDPDSDRTALLNVSAAAVLDLCDGRHTTEEIAAEIADAFSVKVEAVRGDVDSSLRDFMEQRLLESSWDLAAMKTS